MFRFTSKCKHNVQSGIVLFTDKTYETITGKKLVKFFSSKVADQSLADWQSFGRWLTLIHTYAIVTNL